MTATYLWPAENITVGCAIVPYARRCTDASGRHHPEGWAIPGGARTASESHARAVAAQMDRMISQCVTAAPSAGTGEM